MRHSKDKRSGDRPDHSKAASRKKSTSKRHRGTKSKGPRALGGQLRLYGLHTVTAALSNSKRRKSVLNTTENALSRLDPSLVARSGVDVRITEPKALDGMVGTDAVHQGLILECEPLDGIDASELFHLASARLVLVLDQITDPHNVGAILRSAVAFGAAAVLVTRRNSAVETAVLAKSASGALDMMRVIDIRNLSKALNELTDMGFATIGLDSEGPLVLEETVAQTDGSPVALVLGSEGRGLRQQTRETCTYLARLDMPGEIKSLNVSNAAALSLYIASGNSAQS